MDIYFGGVAVKVTVKLPNWVEILLACMLTQKREGSRMGTGFPNIERSRH